MSTDSVRARTNRVALRCEGNHEVPVPDSLPSLAPNLTWHARCRQRERGISRRHIRLAIEQGVRITRSDRVLCILTVGQLAAAGFKHAEHPLQVVVRDERVVTVMWLDGTHGERR